MRVRTGARAILLAATCGVAGGAAAMARADDVCLTVLVTSTLVGDQAVGRCAESPFGVHCRTVDSGFDPAAHVWVTACSPRPEGITGS